MISRKEIKKDARKVLKRHYRLIVCICLISAVVGAEYVVSTDWFDVSAISKPYEKIVAEDGVAMVSSTIDSAESASLTEQQPFIRVLDAFLEGDEEKGMDYAREEKEKAKKQAKVRAALFPNLGGTSGRLSRLVNSVMSGSIVVSLYSAVLFLTGSKNLTIAVLLILSYGIYWYVKYFLRLIYIVTTRRLFLEARIYDTVHLQRFLFVVRVKKMCRVFWGMLVTSIYHTLWSLTIAGYFIKRYSYYLVPYILAENPGLKANEAITLSRRMMKGHKWECFKLELSFAGWMILGIATFGLLELFYIAPYRALTISEYYVRVRQQCKERELAGTEHLNDPYLYCKADRKTLDQAYRDVEQAIRQPLPEPEMRGGLPGILRKWFGILIVNMPGEMEYEKHKAEKIRAGKWKNETTGESYPTRLFSIPEREKRTSVEHLYYARNYSIPSLVLLFFTFSLIGWLWEVSLHLILHGEFVNRGVMHGPWLPIYGAGGILILVLLNKLRERPAVEFMAAVILCGFVEYMTSWYLELRHGMKWWDYSGYLLNLNGRICAEGLIVFGVGAMAIVYFAAPLLDNFFRRVKLRYLVSAACILLILFLSDQMYSSSHPNTGKGISDYSFYDTVEWMGMENPQGS